MAKIQFWIFNFSKHLERTTVDRCAKQIPSQNRPPEKFLGMYTRKKEGMGNGSDAPENFLDPAPHQPEKFSRSDWRELQDRHNTCALSREFSPPVLRATMWSSVRSFVAPQNVQNGWFAIIVLRSFCHAASYPRRWALGRTRPFCFAALHSARCSGHRCWALNDPQSRQGFNGIVFTFAHCWDHRSLSICANS